MLYFDTSIPKKIIVFPFTKVKEKEKKRLSQEKWNSGADPVIPVHLLEAFTSGFGEIKILSDPVQPREAA